MSDLAWFSLLAVLFASGLAAGLAQRRRSIGGGRALILAALPCLGGGLMPVFC